MYSGLAGRSVLTAVTTVSKVPASQYAAGGTHAGDEGPAAYTGRPRVPSNYGSVKTVNKLGHPRPPGRPLEMLALWMWRRRRSIAALAVIAAVVYLCVGALFGRRPFRDAKCFACASAASRLPPNTRVLVAVNSFCGNADFRARIRRTWLPRAKPLGIGVLFYVARSPHCSEAAIAEESGAHGDMVVLPLHESYDKLTVKTHALLLHAEGLEPPVDLLVKADDDIYVDPGRLAGRVWQLHADGLLQRGVYGGLFNNATVVLRDPANKWCDGSYPLSHYPPYASGAAYFMSRPVLAHLATGGRAGALHTGWHNEDASVGSWLFGTSFPRFHDEGILRCLDCATNVFHQPPWAIHVADAGVWSEEAKSSPAPARLVEARRGVLEDAWGAIHGRVVTGQPVRGECCGAVAPPTEQQQEGAASGPRHGAGEAAGGAGQIE